MEILEIPDDDGGQPWLMAACAEVECDWSAGADPILGYADAENELRMKARQHTSNVANDIRRPLDE